MTRRSKRPEASSTRSTLFTLSSSARMFWRASASAPRTPRTTRARARGWRVRMPAALRTERPSSAARMIRSIADSSSLSRHPALSSLGQCRRWMLPGALPVRIAPASGRAAPPTTSLTPAPAAPPFVWSLPTKLRYSESVKNGLIGAATRSSVSRA